MADPDVVFIAAEAAIQQAQRLRAAALPPWDGCCGLVRVCDDQSFREKGLIVPTVATAPDGQATARAAQALQQAANIPPTFNSTSTTILIPAQTALQGNQQAVTNSASPPQQALTASETSVDHTPPTANVTQPFMPQTAMQQPSAHPPIQHPHAHATAASQRANPNRPPRKVAEWVQEYVLDPPGDGTSTVSGAHSATGNPTQPNTQLSSTNANSSLISPANQTTSITPTDMAAKQAALQSAKAAASAVLRQHLKSYNRPAAKSKQEDLSWISDLPTPPPNRPQPKPY